MSSLGLSLSCALLTETSFGRATSWRCRARARKSGNGPRWPSMPVSNVSLLRRSASMTVDGGDATASRHSIGLKSIPTRCSSLEGMRFARTPSDEASGRDCWLRPLRLLSGRWLPVSAGRRQRPTSGVPSRTPAGRPWRQHWGCAPVAMCTRHSSAWAVPFCGTSAWRRPLKNCAWSGPFRSISIKTTRRLSVKGWLHDPRTDEALHPHRLRR